MVLWMGRLPYKVLLINYSSYKFLNHHYNLYLEFQFIDYLRYNGAL